MYVKRVELSDQVQSTAVACGRFAPGPTLQRRWTQCANVREFLTFPTRCHECEAGKFCPCFYSIYGT
jgi:hypothetical protein